MDKTTYIRELISKTGLSARQFALNNDISPSTLNSILTRGIENAGVGVVIKICKALNVSVDDLAEADRMQDVDLVKEEQAYYYNADVQRIVREINEHPGQRMLFDATRSLDEEDLKMVLDLVNRLKKGE